VKREVRLRDGRAVTLRVAAAGDVPRIAQLYSELTPESFRSRFHSGRPKPPVVARLARIDLVPGTVCVLAAMTPESGRLAAEARYLPTAEDTAELAVTVLDDFQDLGLGSLMLKALIEQAEAAGLERLSALVSCSNDAMLHLLTQYGLALADPVDESSAVRLEISAIGGMPGWPRASAGHRVLVERRGWFDDGRFAALQASGHDVRQCFGPDQRSGRTCPLVESGRCRLAEDADRIVTLLSGSDRDCLAVAAAHRRLWPGKIAPQIQQPTAPLIRSSLSSGHLSPPPDGNAGGRRQRAAQLAITGDQSEPGRTSGSVVRRS
jgi:L-amino acid N-acyltransferase YncA